LRRYQQASYSRTTHYFLEETDLSYIGVDAKNIRARKSLSGALEIQDRVSLAGSSNEDDSDSPSWRLLVSLAAQVLYVWQ